MMNIGIYETLMLACLVLFLGRFIVNKIAFLKKYSIPEPVVGGFILALMSWLVLVVFDIELEFNEPFRDVMMYVFFA